MPKVGDRVDVIGHRKHVVIAISETGIYVSSSMFWGAGRMVVFAKYDGHLWRPHYGLR